MENDILRNSASSKLFVWNYGIFIFMPVINYFCWHLKFASENEYIFNRNIY